jgi:hypothetical protein
MLELVTNELFDLEKTHEYVLSIQVSLNGFSFFIELPAENKLLAVKNSPLKISNDTLIARHFNEWVINEDLLQKPFKKIRVIIYSDKFTLVPDKYFHDTLKSKIPHLLFDENSELEIAENVIGKLNTRLIFTLPPGINNVISDKIGECEIVHPVKIILNNLPEIKNENGLILFFDSKHFYILLFNKDKILFVNSFKHAHVNDIVYYVLTTLKQLKILFSETELFLSNTNNNYAIIKDSLKPYFEEIQNMQIVPFLSDVEMASQLKD